MIKSSPYACELINEKNSEYRHLFLSRITLKIFVCYLLLSHIRLHEYILKQSFVFIILYNLTHLIFLLSQLSTTTSFLKGKMIFVFFLLILTL